MSATASPSARPRILVVGGGFGGYFATRALCRRLKAADAEIILVSDTDALLYQPLLPEVAVGALDPRSIAVPLNKTLPGARVIRGRAHQVDLAGHSIEVTTAAREITVTYDYLLLAAGAVTRMRDIPGLADHAVGLKTAAEALYIRELVLAKIETAAAEPDADRRQAGLTFVVIGAGYAGTELAAQMVRLTENMLPGFPTVSPDEIRWLLVDMAPAVMPELGKKLGDVALALLRKRGVDVRLKTSIDRIDGDTVHLTDGTVLGCSTVIWCAGVAANPLIGTLGLPVDKGRLVVNSTLDVPGHPEVFAIGDAAAVPDISRTGGDPVLCPPTAQHAMRQGPAAARNIAARIAGRPLRPYRHRDLGLVVDLGGAGAVAKPLGITLQGWPAKLVTRGYHVYALPTLKRRLSVLTSWALAGRRPNDVSFGYLDLNQALAARAESPS